MFEITEEVKKEINGINIDMLERDILRWILER